MGAVCIWKPNHQTAQSDLAYYWNCRLTSDGEKIKKSGQHREVCTGTLPPLTQYLSYAHSLGWKTISGCLRSTWEISQGYKLSHLPSFSLQQCRAFKGMTLGFLPRFHFFSQHITPFLLPSATSHLSTATMLCSCIQEKLKMNSAKM